MDPKNDPVKTDSKGIAMKLAIIEDSTVVANFFRRFLDDTDYQVQLYSSSPEDIYRLEEEGADVVICPGFPKYQEGPFIVSLLKADPKFKNTMVIVSTSLETTDLQSDWDLDNIGGILIKPFTEQTLKDLLDQISARHRALNREIPIAVVVDDSTTVRSILREEMKSLGFDVKTAADGQEGVALILETMPDIVLTDIEMPKKNGLELCRDLSGNSKTNHIPIIVISTLVNDENIRHWFHYGASHFLQKPVSPESLAEIVTDLLGHSHQGRRGSALVAENTPTAAAIIRKELNSIGVRSNLCRTASELDAYLAVCRPDLITLDLSMADGNGPELCRKLRARNELQSTSIVLISEDNQRDIIVECLNMGANDFLTKPFTRTEFRARVQTHLRTKNLLDELAHRNRILEALAYKDGLTGLMNRRYLDEALERELVKAQNTGDCLGFLILDLDHFKLVNDTYGHNIGDEILKDIALIIQECVGNNGIPCRYGGEEMCVFLPDVPLTKTKEIAERIRSACENNCFTEHGIKQTLSIGLSMFPHLSPRESLVTDADQALYQAKSGGRNRVMTHSAP